MDKKQIKRGAAVAASAAALVGLVFATPSIAEAKGHSNKSGNSSSVSAKSTAPKFDGKGKGKAHGLEANHVAPADQTVTVEVPADGKTYKLVVTEVVPAAAAASTVATDKIRPAHTFVVAVTGTGSVTVTVPGLRPGSYTAELVAVASSQTITVVAPVAPVTPAPSITPAPSNG